VFIGHVDAGKSTTCGNMLVLTGSVDERTIAKYEREAKEKNRESWYLAYVMDTNEEERAKGKTVEVGRAHFATAAKRYTILDAPGHKNYVPNMVVGAAQADIGVLIVSARKGEFESGFEKGGQTREHAMLAKTLGVQTLVVAINKMDDPTINWDKGRYDEIEAKVSPFLKTCGYNLKRDVVYMPVSGLTGANLIEPVSTAVCPWAQGPSLLQLLDGLKPLARDPNAPLRLPIVDRYKEMGVLHVNGKVESGTLARGAKIIIMPAKLTTEVSAILVDEVEVDMVRPGENVLLKLKSLEEEDLHQGYVICPYDNPCKKTQVFDALISVLELLPHKPILSAGYTAVLHVHSLIAEVVIADMLTQTDKKTGIVSKKKPTFCRSGDLVTCRIQVEMPIAVEPFKDVQQLGRFTLRDEGKTIGMGKILKLVDSVDSAVDSSM
jgi:peptide chain release factor subunit 3